MTIWQGPFSLTRKISPKLQFENVYIYMNTGKLYLERMGNNY